MGLAGDAYFDTTAQGQIYDMRLYMMVKLPLWIAAFALFVRYYAVMFCTARVDGQPG